MMHFVSVAKDNYIYKYMVPTCYFKKGKHWILKFKVFFQTLQSLFHPMSPSASPLTVLFKSTNKIPKQYIWSHNVEEYNIFLGE